MGGVHKRTVRIACHVVFHGKYYTLPNVGKVIKDFMGLARSCHLTCNLLAAMSYILVRIPINYFSQASRSLNMLQITLCSCSLWVSFPPCPRAWKPTILQPQGRVTLCPPVYFQVDIDIIHTINGPKPSPSVFACCKQ